MSTNEFKISRRSLIGFGGVGLALAATGLTSTAAGATATINAADLHPILAEHGSTLRVFAANGRELWSHSSFGPGRLQLNGSKATLVTCGEVLVANSGNARVDRFGANGRYLGELQLPGEDARFVWPVALAPFNNGVLVADSIGHALYEFDETLRFVAKHGGNGELNGPSQLLKLDDTTLVLDRGNHRVLALSSDGALRPFTSHEFYLPASLRSADDGTVRVRELGEANELAFDTCGRLVRAGVA